MAEEVEWALAKEAIGVFSWASLFILQPLFYICSWIGPVLQGTKLNSKGTHLPTSHSLWRYRQKQMITTWCGGKEVEIGPGVMGAGQQQGPADPWWPMEGATMLSSSSHQECVQVFILPAVLKTTVNIFYFQFSFCFHQNAQILNRFKLVPKYWE